MSPQLYATPTNSLHTDSGGTGFVFPLWTTNIIRMDNLTSTQDTAFLSPKTQLLLDYTLWPYEIINGPLKGLNGYLPVLAHCLR